MLNNYENQSREMCTDLIVQESIKSNTAQEEHKKAKRKNRNFFTKTALAATICIVLSFFSSYAGAALGNSASSNGESSLSASEMSQEVIYQSVVRTSNTSQTSESLSISDIAELAAVSVVEITTETVTNGSRMGQYVSQGAGSGVIITNDGYIVTNNHVISGANTITVRLSNGNTYNAALIGKDEQTDLAVIKIEENNLTPAIFGSSSELKVGELAVAIGNPLGELGGTVTDGIISALDREITIDGETMTLLQTNAAINPGNSGGGLFNSLGELIGIVNAKSSGSDVEGLGFAIPSDTAEDIISELITNGYVSGRVSLDISIVDITNASTAMMYRVSNLGAYVYKASENSLFNAGDLICSINSETVQSSSDIKAILKNYSIGDIITVSVLRNGNMQNLSITLSELKS